MQMTQVMITSLSYFEVSGYDFVYVNHPSNKTRGGTGILVKSSI